MSTCIRVLFVLLLASGSARADGDEIFWLWAIDGRFEVSKSPCTSHPQRGNPARQAVLAFIGSETYVRVNGDDLDLLRGAKTMTVDAPAKRLVGPGNVPISIWYSGSRTWIVTLDRRTSPAFATVTLVMERNAKRQGTPVCHERWIAPVSP